MDKTDIPGGYRVQYADEAQRQIEELPSELRAALQRKIQVASAVNPYTHGRVEGGIADRLRMHEERVSALVWVSSDVRVLTVVGVQIEDSDPELVTTPEDFSVDEDT